MFQKYRISLRTRSPFLTSQSFCRVTMVITCLVFVISSALAVNDAKDLILTSKEKDALLQLKAQVTSLLTEKYMKTDFYLIRWVRVANLDVPAAKRLLLENVEWRATNNISNIISEDFSDMEEDFPIHFGAHDKNGRPLVEMNVADWDIRAASINGNRHRLRRYLSQFCEKVFHSIMQAQKLPTKKPVTRAMVLVDTDGINIRQQVCPSCMPVLMEWAVLMDSHYPMTLDEVIIINAPQVGVIALNTIRPLLGPELRDRIRIFDGNRETWQRYLDQRVDKNQRTKRYGGIKGN